MAAAGEDWGAFDTTIGDGLESVPWSPARPRRIAEPAKQYKKPRRPKSP